MPSDEKMSAISTALHLCSRVQPASPSGSPHWETGKRPREESRLGKKTRATACEFATSALAVLSTAPASLNAGRGTSFKMVDLHTAVVPAPMDKGRTVQERIHTALAFVARSTMRAVGGGHTNPRPTHLRARDATLRLRDAKLSAGGGRRDRSPKLTTWVDHTVSDHSVHKDRM